MVSRSLASLRRPCILLCQEGAVEEPARTELGQRGRSGYSPFSINGILSILILVLVKVTFSVLNQASKLNNAWFDVHNF